MARWAEEWGKRIDDEAKNENKDLKIKNTGKLDPKRHIGEVVDESLNENIQGILGEMISTYSF